MAYFVRFCGDYTDCEIVILKKKKLAGSYFWFIETQGLMDFFGNKVKAF